MKDLMMEGQFGDGSIIKVSRYSNLDFNTKIIHKPNTKVFAYNEGKKVHLRKQKNILNPKELKLFSKKIDPSNYTIYHVSTATQTVRLGAQVPYEHELLEMRLTAGVYIEYDFNIEYPDEILNMISNLKPDIPVKDITDKINKYIDIEVRAVVTTMLDQSGIIGLEKNITKASDIITSNAQDRLAEFGINIVFVTVKVNEEASKKAIAEEIALQNKIKGKNNQD